MFHQHLSENNGYLPEKKLPEGKFRQ